MSTLTMNIFYRGSCTLFSDNFICVYNTLWPHSSLNPLLSSFLSHQLWSPPSSAHHTSASFGFGLVVWPTGFSRECETIHRHWNVTPQWLYHWRQCQWLSLPQQLFTVIGSHEWGGASETFAIHDLMPMCLVLYRHYARRHSHNELMSSTTISHSYDSIWWPTEGTFQWAHWWSRMIKVLFHLECPFVISKKLKLLYSTDIKCKPRGKLHQVAESCSYPAGTMPTSCGEYSPPFSSRVTLVMG